MRLLVIIALLVGGAAYAEPTEELGAARQAFREGRFKEAVPMLTKLLYPEAQLGNRTEPRGRGVW